MRTSNLPNELFTNAKVNNLQKNEINFTSAEEVLNHYQMGWIAELQPLMTGAGLDVPSHKAIVRNDNNSIIGIVGKDYQPIQNSDAFGMFDALCQKHGASYVKGVQIDGGKRIYLQARIGTGEVKKGDVVENRITIFNSFDGSSSYRIFMTPYRLICLNGMMSAVKENALRVSIRHSKNAMNRYEEALKVFSIANEEFQKFLVTSRRMADIILDKAKVIQLIKDTFEESKTPLDEISTNTRNKMNQVYRLYQSGKGNSGATLYDFVNGVTEYTDHFASANKSQDEQDIYAMVGTGSKLKEKAFEASMELMNNLK